MKSKLLHIFFLLIIHAAAFSQEMRVVSGVIRDNEGYPIPGVNIVEKNTTNGTVTDMNGYYEITVCLGSTIQVSFIGMRTSEMKVTEANSKPAGSHVRPSRTAINPVNPPQPLPVKEKEIENTRIDDPDENRSNMTFSRGVDQTLSPYFLVKSDSAVEGAMPLKKTDVEVNIAGVIADVCVKQVYINESPRTLEAVYVFPGSTRAAVYGMTMVIGNRRIDAKIKKKEQARKEYEKAKEEGKSTTLLEQHRPNVFQMNVANILSGDTIVVEMRYTELLEHQGGLYEFVYPTVVGPRYTEGGEQWAARSEAMFESGITPAFSINTVIQAGMPIRKISSSSHSLTIESTSPDCAVVSLSNPKDFEGNRDYILHYDLQGGKVESGLLRYEHGDENFFLLMMQPPKQPTSDQIPSREYVFIVDVSGSMHGFPISVSKQLIRNLVSSLRPIDRFNVMLFESSNAMLYKESISATEDNINQALSVIDQQRGSGGTRMYPAIVNAMNFKGTEGFSRTFIIVTDGYVTVEKEAFAYVRSHLNEANLFAFGIGPSVNRYMIEGLAHAGAGTPYIVTNLTQAEEVGKKAIRDISQPVLTKISVDWDDFDVYDVEPAAIPDVFTERPILVYGKYKTPAKGTITVEGISGNSRYEQKFDAAQARTDNNQALRYLWARNQIRYYDDYAQYYEGDNNSWNDYYGNHQRSAKQIDYVTKLGLKYNLLTQYTSFLAVDEEVRKPKPAPERQRSSSSTPQYKASAPTPTTVTSPDFQLDEESHQLEEVVTIGYGTVTKRDVTGGISSISTSEISGAVPQVLQGRVAGVAISQTSGEPGDASRIRIRGTSSVTDNSNPLVVLDGAPVEYSAIQNMDANNIESISILKDASAAALYGSRAANGVIVVTSKTPKYQKLSVALSSSFSVESPNRLPEMQDQFAQGRPVNGIPVWNTADESFAWGPSTASVNAPTFDAYDILRTGHTFKNYLTLSGRHRKYRYGVKLGNNTQRGFFPDSKFGDNSVNLKLGHESNSGFEYDINLGYANTRGNRLQRGYNMSGIMQGILLTPPTFDNGAGSTLSDGSQRAAGTATDNPYWTIDNNPFDDEANRLNGNISLNYKLFQALSLQYRLSGEYLSGESKTALNRGSVYYAPGHVMNRDEKFRSLNSVLTAKYDKSWDGLQMNSTVGYEYSNSGRSIDRTDGYKLIRPGDYSIQNADSVAYYDQSYYRHSNAIFAKVGFNYRQMLMLETAARGEWSSTTADALFSPSVGVAANLHEMFDAYPFTQIKLHANAARADKETPLYLDPVYFNSAVYNLNDASQHFETREVAPGSLKPESIATYETGANIGLWNHRITASAAWYWKNGKNQLLPVQISTSSVQLENGGTFKTHGFEAELEARIVQRRNVSWSTRFVFSRERNRVTNLGGKTLMLAGIEGVAGSYAIEGQPLGVLYGTAYQRDAQGRMLIGTDGFPIVSNEMQVLGNPNPDWQLGWVNNVEYRKFTLSVLLDYKKGGKMWNGTRNAMNYYGTSQYSADNRNTANYIFPGVLPDGSANNIPVNFYGDNLADNRWVRYGQYGVGEDGIEDASYLKLREISLGYRIPIRILQKQTRLKVSIYATNILLYSKYKGVDPETNLTGSSNGFGLDYFNIPGVYSMGIGVNWEF